MPPTYEYFPARKAMLYRSAFFFLAAISILGFVMGRDNPMGYIITTLAITIATGVSFLFNRFNRQPPRLTVHPYGLTGRMGHVRWQEVEDIKLVQLGAAEQPSTLRIVLGNGADLYEDVRGLSALPEEILEKAKESFDRASKPSMTA